MNKRNYSYDAMKDIRLPEKYLDIFIARLNDRFNIDVSRSEMDDNELRENYHFIIENVTSRALNNSYKDRANYLLATNVRERAIAAYEGPTSTAKQDILDIWLGVVAEMTELEKAMTGWDG